MIALVNTMNLTIMYDCNNNGGDNSYGGIKGDGSRNVFKDNITSDSRIIIQVIKN